MESKTIGYNIQAPKSDATPDKHCPFHSSLKVRGNIMKGTVVSASAQLSAIVEVPRQVFVAKYKRYQKKISRFKVHNPAVIAAKVGDVVEFIGCRPISKTKSMTIVRIVESK
ncbi:MAG: 30S ribosomal protein S17 [Candidatus Woesearchaeota archaeon]